MFSRISGGTLIRNFYRTTIFNSRRLASVKLKDENAPERPLNAYTLFVKERSIVLKDQSSESLSFSDISKACATQWKALSEGEKQQYHDQVKPHVDEFKKKMIAYKQSEEYANFKIQKAAHDKREKMKEFKLPSAPKKALTAYIYYGLDNRAKLKEANPDASLTDMAKMLGAAWKNLPEEEKLVYEEKAKQDKIRYEEEKEQHEKTTEYLANKSKKEEYLNDLKNNSSAAKEKDKTAKAKAKAKEKEAKEKAAEAKAKKKAAAAKAKEKAAEIKAKEKAAKEKAKAKEKEKAEKAKAKKEKEKAELEKKKAKEKREKEKEKLAAAKAKEKLKTLASKGTKNKKVAASS